ncbi:hypothetical protein [Shewanella marisflavi]|uniref:hypothetical protein n=1 Tax=Shewanella marisflavi TaxID=260364 RepID=UPI003AAE7016
MSQFGYVLKIHVFPALARVSGFLAAKCACSFTVSRDGVGESFDVYTSALSD